MIWYLVIWWSVIPTPYASLADCNRAMSIMSGALVDASGTITPRPLVSALPFDGGLSVDTSSVAYPKSWCIPAPKP